MLSINFTSSIPKKDTEMSRNSWSIIMRTSMQKKALMSLHRYTWPRPMVCWTKIQFPITSVERCEFYFRFDHRTGHSDVTALLLENNADVNALNIQKKTACDLAVANCRLPKRKISVVLKRFVTCWFFFRSSKGFGCPKVCCIEFKHGLIFGRGFH